VLLLFAVILAMTAPALRGAWRDARFRAASRAVTARLNYAHRKSIIKAVPVRVVFDKTKNSTLIEIQKDTGSFEPLRTAEARDLPLPQGASFAEISGQGVEPGATKATVTFFPDGTAQARRIIIANKDNESITITVHPATGVTAVQEM
jgi:Tfp pilus assembly protein FimT